MRINKLAAAALLGVAALGLERLRHRLPDPGFALSRRCPRRRARASSSSPPIRPIAAGSNSRHTPPRSRRRCRRRAMSPPPRPQAATMLVQVDYGVDQGQQRDRHRSLRQRLLSRRLRRLLRSLLSAAASTAGPIIRATAAIAAACPFITAGTIPSGARRSTTAASTPSTRASSTSTSAAAATMPSLFEGHAKARSQTDNLRLLVPNLIEAMFTGFPGRSGEQVPHHRPAARSAAPARQPVSERGRKARPERSGRAFLASIGKFGPPPPRVLAGEVGAEHRNLG